MRRPELRPSRMPLVQGQFWATAALVIVLVGVLFGLLGVYI